MVKKKKTRRKVVTAEIRNDTWQYFWPLISVWRLVANGLRDLWSAATPKLPTGPDRTGRLVGRKGKERWQ